MARQTPYPVFDRIGIHIGEVVIEEREGVENSKDPYGIQVDICSRIMSLGVGGQILTTRSVFDNAKQVLKGKDIEGPNYRKESYPHRTNNTCRSWPWRSLLVQSLAVDNRNLRFTCVFIIASSIVWVQSVLLQIICPPSSALSV